MTTYTRPVVNGTPMTGQVVKAAHVNEPIDQIYDTILAGGITADQIAAGAVDTSELATAAVTAAKMDGTLPDTSAMATSAAPTTDAQLANKKYVDDNIDSAYSGGESHTFGGGLIFKMGSDVAAGSEAEVTVTFGTAFPTAIVTAVVCLFEDLGNAFGIIVKTQSAANIVVKNETGSAKHFNWIAIGH